MGSDPIFPRSRRPAWLPWGVVGGIAALTIVLIAATRSSSPPAASSANPSDAPRDAALSEPPANDRAMDDRDRDKVFDQVDKGHYREALDKLDEWEDHHGGATPETDELRRQIEGQQAADPRPPGHGKHGKHGRD